MRTTIDTAGRVVVPKSLRERLGLSGGQEVEVIERDGHIEIEPAPTPMRLRRKGRARVLETDRAMPVLTAAMVRDTLEQVRR